VLPGPVPKPVYGFRPPNPSAWVLPRGELGVLSRPGPGLIYCVLEINFSKLWWAVGLFACYMLITQWVILLLKVLLGR